MSINSHKSYNKTASNWGRCFIAQPTVGAGERDTTEGVA